MARVAKSKPSSKPYPAFPLTAHRNGSWCKKVRGKVIYFGPLADHQAALDLWLKEKDELLAGRPASDVRSARPTAGQFTIQDACNAFLAAKESSVDTNGISRRHFDDLCATCRLLVSMIDKTWPVDYLKPEHFAELHAKLAQRFGPVTLLNSMIRIRSVFKHALDNRLIAQPVFYGSAFAVPSKKELRLQRAKKGERLISAADLKRLIESASVQMKAMILLAINTGCGNSDCGQLEERHLDLAGGWLNYPRPKTGINRRCKLWDETIDLIRLAIAERPTSKSDDNSTLVFLTRCGEPWSRDTRDNPISQAFRKLLDAKGLYRPGLGFYCLRHVFETVAGATRDQVAVDHAMGHCDESMAARYRERIDDSRLEAVSDHVHAWLFGEVEKAIKPSRKPKAKAERPALRVVG